MRNILVVNSSISAIKPTDQQFCQSLTCNSSRHQPGFKPACFNASEHAGDWRLDDP